MRICASSAGNAAAVVATSVAWRSTSSSVTKPARNRLVVRSSTFCWAARFFLAMFSWSWTPRSVM